MFHFFVFCLVMFLGNCAVFSFKKLALVNLSNKWPSYRMIGQRDGQMYW